MSEMTNPSPDTTQPATRRTKDTPSHRITEALLDRATPISQLDPHPQNARRRDERAEAELRQSLEVNGQYRTVVARELGERLQLLAGHGTVQAARQLGWTHVAVDVHAGLSDEAAARIVLVDNRTNDLAGYDDALLTELLSSLPDLAGTGYDDEALSALLAGFDGAGGPAALTDPDDVPVVPEQPRSALGDLWLLGPHRLICGDTTDPEVVRRLVGPHIMSLIHADPPYGMGKEADGVLNDNLYGPKLDGFQMQWWRTWRTWLAESGSAYIWGNAPDLWRLWWVGGLSGEGDLLVRNEIVWDKGSGIGMRSAGEHSYPTSTERALFLMRGEQFLGNQNKDDFWEGYEPLRAWLCAERDKVGWSNRDVNGLTETQMAGHWFTQSQFMPISKTHYQTLRDAASGRAFAKDYDDLFAEMFPDLRSGGNQHRRDLAAEMRATRSYFDNTHDAMTDVWQFGRVTGEERFGHATPKPVAMVERALLSSSEPGDLVGVPFGGTGPEFIAAHRLGRRCVGAELQPAYVDVICRRYQEHTGVVPVLESTGEPVDFTTAAQDE